MTLTDAISTLPDWVRLWVLWLNIVVFGSFAILLFSHATWRSAAALLGANLLMVPAMLWLYGQVGFVRLLGLPHVIFWTPLVIFLFHELRTRPEIRTPFRQVLWVLVASLAVSLVFDISDVVRYLLGERASLLPPASSAG